MKKKTLTIAIALVLVVALAVGATWAYLTAKTEAVTNTFTVGKLFDQGGAFCVSGVNKSRLRRAVRGCTIGVQ